MKKIILIGSMFLMFMGVASASSINGNYKGSPIVKIFNQGIEIKSDDVPAIIYNGRTVVPVSLLTKIGISLVWDQKDYSLNVILPEIGTAQTAVSTNTGSDKSVQTLKIYSEITDQYRKLMVLGDVISDLNSTYFLAFSRIISNNDPNEAVLNANKNLNNVIDAYNESLTPTTELINRSSNLGINVHDIDTILSEFSKSIDSFKAAYAALEGYRDNKSDTNYKNYDLNNQQGFEISKNPRENSLSKYYEFYNKLQEF